MESQVLFDIGTKSFKLTLVYLLNVILIAVCIIILSISNIQSDTIDFIFSLILLLLIISIFKIVPNLPIRNYKRLGEVCFSSTNIGIELLGDYKEYNLKDVESLQIHLCGYDGQSQFGSKYIIGMALNPLNGMNNYVEIKNKAMEKKFQFYIKTKSDYESLLELKKGWGKNKNIYVNIIRD